VSAQENRRAVHPRNLRETFAGVRPEPSQCRAKDGGLFVRPFKAEKAAYIAVAVPRRKSVSAPVPRHAGAGGVTGLPRASDQGASLSR
jgi:hypothetical protein